MEKYVGILLKKISKISKKKSSSSKLIMFSNQSRRKGKICDDN